MTNTNVDKPVHNLGDHVYSGGEKLSENFRKRCGGTFKDSPHPGFTASHPQRTRVHFSEITLGNIPLKLSPHIHRPYIY